MGEERRYLGTGTDGWCAGPGVVKIDGVLTETIFVDLVGVRRDRRRWEQHFIGGSGEKASNTEGKQEVGLQLLSTGPPVQALLGGPTSINVVRTYVDPPCRETNGPREEHGLQTPGRVAGSSPEWRKSLSYFVLSNRVNHREWGPILVERQEDDLVSVETSREEVVGL